MNVPGIKDISLTAHQGQQYKSIKEGAAKMSIKKRMVGVQTVYDVQLEFFSRTDINHLLTYDVAIATVSGSQYLLGGAGLPSPIITSEFKDGKVSENRGWSYKINYTSTHSPLI